jgi:HK97 gp10 family phage protein
VIKLVTVYNGIPKAITEVKVGAELAEMAAKEAISERAKQEVPVLTGALQDTIEITDEGVVAGEGLDYGAYVHFGTSRMAGTPFLSMAMPSGQRAMQAVLRSLLRG